MRDCRLFRHSVLFGGIDMSDAKNINELPACPVETTLTLIGDKWKVLILRDILPGKKALR